MLKEASDRFYGAWWGAFLGDAAAMPTHGFSSEKLLHEDYGEVKEFKAPKPTHPESALRTIPAPILPPEFDYIGETRRHLWRERDAHPHCGMDAGENTLPVYLALHLAVSMCEKGEFDIDDWMERYRLVMTTPGGHRDTFIPSVHRKYFENLATGKDPEANGCPEAHMGDIATFAPLMLFIMRNPEKSQMGLYRALKKFSSGESAYSAAFFIAELLSLVIKGDSIETAIYEKMTPDRHFSLAFPYRRWIKNRDDAQAVNSTGIFATVDEGLPLSLYICLKYGGDFSAAIFANANIGGESTGRGVVIGMLAGAQAGFSRLPQDLIARLKYAGEIQAVGDMLHKLVAGV